MSNNTDISNAIDNADIHDDMADIGEYVDMEAGKDIAPVTASELASLEPSESVQGVQPLATFDFQKDVKAYSGMGLSELNGFMDVEVMHINKERLEAERLDGLLKEAKVNAVSRAYSIGVLLTVFHKANKKNKGSFEGFRSSMFAKFNMDKSTVYKYMRIAKHIGSFATIKNGKIIDGLTIKAADTEIARLEKLETARDNVTSRNRFVKEVIAGKKKKKKTAKQIEKRQAGELSKCLELELSGISGDKRDEALEAIGCKDQVMVHAVNAVKYSENCPDMLQHIKDYQKGWFSQNDMLTVIKSYAAESKKVDDAADVADCRGLEFKPSGIKTAALIEAYCNFHNVDEVPSNDKMDAFIDDMIAAYKPA